MRIALVATNDSGGGFWATYRLLEALERAGVDACLFVVNSKTDHNKVNSPSQTYAKYWHRILRFLDGMPSRFYPNRSKIIFSNGIVGSEVLIRNIKRFQPDILHLHWICGGALQLSKLKEFHIPIVWSHHDMWAFTGGCHYTGECANYLQSCGDCPILKSNKKNDLSRQNFEMKSKIYQEIESLTNIGLSTWMLDELNKSMLMKEKKNLVLPNPIDTTYFKNTPKNQAKSYLGLRLDRKYILFSAINSTTDKRKGFSELYRALQIMPKNNDIELLVMGGNKNKALDEFEIPVRYLGLIEDWDIIKIIYSSVDMMITPSLQENLSNAIMECLSCGTPVVAFNIGGNPDLISHQENGYLVDITNPSGLADGIQWVLSNLTEHLGLNARNSIIEKFDYKVVTRKYIEFYEKLLS
ncbi:glycosyltransferase [Alphaproteobacteria bacterium]|nr:glycosyltransferase [Alphaproteobacteria bacterium]